MKSVYDLDGTLISFNTFKIWIVLSFFISIFCFRLFFLFRIIEFSIVRKMGGMNRLIFKNKILAIQTNSRFWLFIGKLYGLILARYFLRHDLLALGSNTEVCLATAAPSIYVKPFVDVAGGFALAIYSHFTEDGIFVETLNEVKLQFVRDKFSDEPDLFFTDHYDDIPLAKISKYTYIVSPTEKSKQLFASSLDTHCYSFIK